MADLQGLPTKEALQTLGEAFKEAIKKYALVDVDGNQFYTGNITRTYFDQNGVLTVLFEIPVEENITTPANSFALLDENNAVLVEVPLPTQIEFITGFGGEIPVKIPISGQPATVVFKADSYITETEAKEIFLLPLIKNTQHLLALEEKLIEKGIIKGGM